MPKALSTLNFKLYTITAKLRKKTYTIILNNPFFSIFALKSLFVPFFNLKICLNAKKTLNLHNEIQPQTANNQQLIHATNIVPLFRGTKIA